MKGVSFQKKVLVLCSMWCALFPGLLFASSIQEQQQSAPPPRHLQAFCNLLLSLDCKPKVTRMSNASKVFLGRKIYTLVKKTSRNIWYKLFSFSQYCTWIVEAIECPKDSKESTSSQNVDSQNSYQQSQLLLSGDVELNPGPGRFPKSSTPVSNPDEDYVIVRNPPAEAEPIPVPAQVSQKSEHARESTEGTSNSGPKVVGTLSSSQGSSKSIPGTQVVASPRPSKHLSMSVKSDPGLHTLSERLSPPSTYEKLVKERKPSLAKDGRLTKCLSTDPTADDCLMMMMSNRKNMTSDRITLQNKEKYAKTCEESMSRLLHDFELKQLWSRKDGFRDPKHTDLFQFYLIANQIIVYKQCCQVCLLCGKDLNNNDSRPVFPRFLIEAFSIIHGEETATKTNSSKFVLFCLACEAATLESEKKLRDLYVTIINPEHQDNQIEVHEPHWLLHVMATIMYRGILTTNLFDDLHHDFTQIIHALSTLRSFVANPPNNMKDVVPDIIKKFGLYILQNSSTSPDGPNYLLSQHLRLPQPTSVVGYQETAFFYTKFDCFHCVLQYNDTTIPELDLASNCFSQVHSDTLNDTGAPYEFIFIQTSEKREKIFPKVLVEENIKSALTHQMNMLISQESAKPLSMPTYHYTFTLQTPTCVVIDTKEARIFKPLPDNKYTEICSNAKKESPFCHIDTEKECLVKGSTALREQVEHITRELKSSEQRTSEMTHREQQLSSEISRLTSENQQLKDKIARLEGMLKLTHGEYCTDSDVMYDPPLRQM